MREKPVVGPSGQKDIEASITQACDRGIVVNIRSIRGRVSSSSPGTGDLLR